ncbi:MAG: xylulose kinase, partial [Actinobacteria bacterium]|nr:xylulose kinase [Actinomycetota bacterium]
MANKLVAGIDSSTQSVKVVIKDANTGQLIREGKAAHPDGTSVHPSHWMSALDKAIKSAGGLSDVSAISVAGQQHGFIALDQSGEVIREALLWNDLRSAQAAKDLNAEFGGKAKVAEAIGSVLVASFTVTKLRWLVDSEPENAKKLAGIALPHDWISWQLQGGKDFDKLFTDRSDASGTGYFAADTNMYRRDLLVIALREERDIYLPKVAKFDQFAGVTTSGIPIAAGAGDNAAAGFGLGAKSGDLIISLGTSGTAFFVSDKPSKDQSGEVAGFADLTGRYLPLVCTLNAARVLDTLSKLLGKSHDEIGKLALAAKPGCDGLTMLGYFEGERTPNRPDAKGLLAGITNSNLTAENIARAGIEAIICGLVDSISTLQSSGAQIERVMIIGGAAKNPGIGPIASAILGRPVMTFPPREFVADGAARQAAWA